jgi:hypothetical protein
MNRETESAKTMTIPEILNSVAAVVGSYSEASFRRDAKRLNIKPLGTIRHIPRRYPPETAALIMADRGVTVINGTGKRRLLPLAKFTAARKAKRKGGAR